MGRLTFPVTVRVPGKLMIGGEYAVLELGQPSVVTAVDRFVTCTAEPASRGELMISGHERLEVTWRIAADGVEFSTPLPRLRFIRSALSVASQFFEQVDGPLEPYRLTVDSQLDDPSGRKYGLGSSAAVTVAVMAAIFAAQCGGERAAPADLLFRLSAIAHLRAQGSGSGADVAACAFGAGLRYVSFHDHSLMADVAAKRDVRALAAESWPHLSVSPLARPAHLRWCVGWTGEPAFTKSLVAQVRTWKERQALRYQAFLHRSAQAVAELVAGIRADDPAQVMPALRANGEALSDLGKWSGTPIVTPIIERACELARQVGGAAKPSGAGGGDCVIAALESDAAADKLAVAWREVGIEPLSLNVWADGPTQIPLHAGEPGQ